MWWLWVLAGLAAWLVVGLLVALLIGRTVRLAERRERAADVAQDADPNPAPRQAPARRRRLPLPTVGVALAALAVAFEAAGFLGRLTGATGAPARLLSMDAPLSLPRLYVAALFAAAALAALAGAGSIPGRRTWWTAVAAVAGLVTAVKASGVAHAAAFGWLADRMGLIAATVVGVACAALAVGWLGFLSRAERRDLARVLSALGLYAGAAVGLSALSSLAADAYGSASSWAAGATFVEESGEALSAVLFLVAVLAGVAPRLVLPAGWPLRRAVDPHTLDLPEPVPGRAADGSARS